MTNLKDATIEQIEKMEVQQLDKHPICGLCAYSDFAGKDLKSVLNYLIYEADQDLKDEVYAYLKDVMKSTPLVVNGPEILKNLKDIKDHDFISKTNAAIKRYYELVVGDDELNSDAISNFKQVSQLTWNKLKGMYDYDLGSEGSFLKNMLMHEDPKGWDFDNLYYFAKSITNSSDAEVLSKWIATEFYQTDFAWTCNYLGFNGFIRESEANGTFSQCYPNG